MRPIIICHMATSIDGRLHHSRFTPAAQGICAAVLRGHYEQVADRLGADGWIVGRKTMSEISKAPAREIAEVSTTAREPHLADRKGRSLAVAIDPSGRIPWASPPP